MPFLFVRLIVVVSLLIAVASHRKLVSLIGRGLLSAVLIVTSVRMNAIGALLSLVFARSVLAVVLIAYIIVVVLTIGCCFVVCRVLSYVVACAWKV